MSGKIDYKIASSDIITKNIGQRLADLRLSGNITQEELASQAGIATRTLRRVESGQGASVDTLIRLLQALGLANNLDLLLPQSGPAPMDNLRQSGTGKLSPEPKERQRARKKKTKPGKPWSWNDKETP